MEGCQGEGRTGEWGDKEGERGAGKRAGEEGGGETEAGEQVSAWAPRRSLLKVVCFCTSLLRAHPCACNCVRVCVHEHADVYSFPRSNAHSQMKSSNVSAREPQLGSHGS